MTERFQLDFDRKKLNTMDIHDLKVKADTYYKSNWSFSSALIWQKIIELNPTSWNLLQYADLKYLAVKGNYR